jgi:phospholipase D1/2
MAFIGGLDLCFGRWDLHQHPLVDVHPQSVRKEIWPGQDFNNNRVMDFQDVKNWKENQLDKEKYGRMPWHDVSIGILGPAVMNIADNFVGVSYRSRIFYRRNVTKSDVNKEMEFYKKR